jgi:hypothetical protein
VHVASDSGETYYYNTETQESQWDSPEGDDVGTGYVEVASDDDAVFGSFPWAAVEELPVTHRLAGEVCKYHVDWKGGTRLRHGVVVHSFKLVEAHGHTISGKLQLSSDALRLLHNDRTLPGYYWTDRPFLAHFPPFFPGFPPFFARFHCLAETVPTSPKPEPRAKKRRHEGQQFSLAEMASCCLDIMFRFNYLI